MYVNVLVPLPLAGAFTYRLSDGRIADVQVGSRVVVPFGPKRRYTGIVTQVDVPEPSGGIAVKDVLAVMDPEPLILPSQLALWRWIADYYLCTEGDVMKAALPSGFNIESDSLRPNYRPRTEQRIRLAEPYRGADGERALSTVLDGLRRAAKQQELLLAFLDLAGYADGSCQREVTRHSLLEHVGHTSATLNALLSKGILEAYEAEISRLATTADGATLPVSTLSTAQQAAFDGIHAAWQQHDVCLLHGVTSSGKTEIYIRLIAEAIAHGQQVLYLMPEIALTTQMENRLRRVFGARLGIYHSRFSAAERVEIWRKQLSDQPYDVILGVRSSVFLPFQRLGLVVIDEEHENTYKQQDPAPRYHARNVAIVLAAQFHAHTLLGTATPSIESYYNALHGKYGLVTLGERWQQVQMPVIQVVDIHDLRRKHRMCGSFSPQLLEAIRDALARGEQAILFQNRRGYAPLLECRSCGWVPRCERCDVPLTWHRRLDQMVCHYCGNVYRVPYVCPQCTSADATSQLPPSSHSSPSNHSGPSNHTTLQPLGLGTERIEEELHALIPDARIDRMDLDTTRAKTAYSRILDDFARGNTDILIGTQMISKGLDFAHVSVVGIMNADTMLSYPDFRSYERAYQLMAQVAGRAGRRDRQGLVILQTRDEALPVIGQVRRYDYEGMFADQLNERQAFHYPPFCRLVFIYLRGRDERHVTETANALRARLSAPFAARILGPEAPAVGRVQGQYIRKLMLKLELDYPTRTARQHLHQALADLSAANALSGITTYFDVDPL